MITIDKLNKSYGVKKALDNLSLSIPAASIYGLLGPNGAGKTTLISILNGLISYESGEILIFGLSLKKNLPDIRSRCSLIPQSLSFYENLTAKENLFFFAGVQRITGKQLADNMSRAVETNHLEEILDQKTATLSGGQRRRLNIAIGMLNNPDILFFDEPTVGVDLESRNQIIETIRGYKSEKKTVVYTSHYMPEIESICDEIAIIKMGQIVQSGSVDSMIHNEEDRQVTIEVNPIPSLLQQRICQNYGELKVVDEKTFLVDSVSSDAIARALSVFEEHEVKIRQIRYGKTTLESAFLNILSPED